MLLQCGEYEVEVLLPPPPAPAPRNNHWQQLRASKVNMAITANVYMEFTLQWAT